MQPKMKNTHEKPVDPLILTIFPGNADSTRVYEDEGNSSAYQKNKCAWTVVRHSGFKNGELKIEIVPVQGFYRGMPQKRGYEVRLPFWWPPEVVLCPPMLLEK